MPSVNAKSIAAVGAVLAGAMAAAPLVTSSEGWVLVAYSDPVGIPTACAGVTKNVVLGHRYTDQECVSITVQALAEHGAAIAPCLPPVLPVETRGAFTSFAYNVGAAKFCASTMAKKARAGDLRGACAELPKWVYAGGKVLRGLVTRRAAEQALCQRGLA